VPNPGYPPAPLGNDAPPRALSDAASTNWLRRVVDVVNRLNQGKANCTGQVTLVANAASTTLIDARISAFSTIVLSPLTADAAAALGTTYISAQQSGSAVITHANNAQADRTFAVAIFG
jgi:LDH2 family malate/lactate/ureidoglycolate dehydrogenase